MSRLTTGLRPPSVGAALLMLALLPAAARARAPSVVDRRADDVRGTPLTWDPAWGDFSAGEWVLTGVAAASLLATAILPPAAHHWRGGVGADEGVRDGLRLSSAGAREAASTSSDVGLILSVSYPLLVDAIIVAAGYRDRPGVGLRMALIDAEVLAVTLAVQGLTNTLTSRERPFGRECGAEALAGGRACTSSNRYRSFFSGHTAASFAAAGATCAHHIFLDLYQDPTADGLACAGALVVAGVTGVLRVASDDHYLSDVLVGAGVGTLIGLGLPWLLHYRFDGDEGDGDGASVSLVPAGMGAALIGVF